MITIPNIGEIDSDTSLACDWIEISCWLDEEPLSKLDVQSTLEDENVFEDNTGPTIDGVDSKQVIMDNTWIELERRSNSYGEAYPFTVSNEQIEANTSNEYLNPYLFFIILSIARHIDHWHETVKEFGYTEQGTLFEHITEKALNAMFPGWNTWISGWGTDENTNWSEMLDELCEQIGAQKTDEFYELWDQPGAKDRGLDILLYKTFEDGRPGLPCYLLQCGSGKHWPKKVLDPEINIWESAIQFFSEPNVGFCCPYYLDHKEFKSQAIRKKPGFFVDRDRLLRWLGKGEPFKPEIEERISAWVSKYANYIT